MSTPDSTPQNIHIFPTIPQRGKSYVVKWRVDGRDRSKSRKTLEQARRYQRQLANALDAGERFDVDTGLPVSWVAATDAKTVAAAAREFVVHRWLSGEYEHGSLSNYLEVLTPVVQSLVRTGRRRPFPHGDDVLRDFIMWDLLTPDDVSSELTARQRRDAEMWLERNSMKVAELTASHIEQLADGPLGIHRGWGPARVRKGQKLGSATVRRRLKVVKAWLKLCRKKGYLDSDPFAAADLSLTGKTKRVDPRRVLNEEQVREFVQTFAGLTWGTRQYAAVLVLAFFGGLRFGELRGLRLKDLCLPENPREWGWVRLEGQVTRARHPKMTGGERLVRSPLKGRDDDEYRTIDLHPWVVGRLREHLDEFRPGIDDDDLVFATRNGTPLAYGAFLKLWHRATAAYGVAAGVEWLSGETPHVARHTAVSMWLQWGIEPPVCAEWSGHQDQATFWNVYAHVLEGRKDAAKGKVDAVMDKWLDEDVREDLDDGRDEDGDDQGPELRLIA